MEARLNYPTLAPEPLKLMYAMEKYLGGSGLERGLIELVKIRASQINGCAYCIDMHTQDARAEGETERRIYALNAWRETPFYTNRERAALAWTEAVTRISDGGVSDALYEEARQHFDEKELVDLTWAVAAINAWNRVAINFRSVPGTYKPARRAQVPAEVTAGN
jgi:AhpD family alkylhydroperoxidase